MLVNQSIGGGRTKFVKQEDGGERTDGENLISTWMKQKESLKKSFSVLYDKKDLDEWATSETDFVLGLFNDSAMPFELERDSDKVPFLEDMTRKAIQRLKKGPNGVFLMVESAGIDKAHHRNWPKKAFEETIMLEKSVQVALDLTDPKDTLIIVTIAIRGQLMGTPKGEMISWAPSMTWEESVTSRITMVHFRLIPLLHMPMDWVSRIISRTIPKRLGKAKLTTMTITIELQHNF